MNLCENGKITAKQLVDLLAIRHSKDVFVPECQTGADRMRMDAWAMPCSWSKPDVTAYEVKVTRSDFVRDDKWPAYLDYCNAFYFVTPPKLISAGELPDGVGLIECTRNATRLLTKRKAARRDVEIPEDVFRYVLMSRAKILTPNAVKRDSREKWRQWLIQRETDRSLGYEVRGKIRELYAENVQRVQHENEDLMRRVAGLENAERILEAMGITSVESWHLERRINEAITGVSHDLSRYLDQASRSIAVLQRLIEKEASPERKDRP